MSWTIKVSLQGYLLNTKITKKLLGPDQSVWFESAFGGTKPTWRPFRTQCTRTPDALRTSRWSPQTCNISERNQRFSLIRVLWVRWALSWKCSRKDWGRLGRLLRCVWILILQFLGCYGGVVQFLRVCSENIGLTRCLQIGALFFLATQLGIILFFLLQFPSVFISTFEFLFGVDGYGRGLHQVFPWVIDGPGVTYRTFLPRCQSTHDQSTLCRSRHLEGESGISWWGVRLLSDGGICYSLGSGDFIDSVFRCPCWSGPRLSRAISLDGRWCTSRDCWWCWRWSWVLDPCWWSRVWRSRRRMGSKWSWRGSVADGLLSFRAWVGDCMLRVWRIVQSFWIR